MGEVKRYRDSIDKIIKDFIKFADEARTIGLSHKPKGFKYQGVFLYGGDTQNTDFLRREFQKRLGDEYHVASLPGDLDSSDLKVFCDGYYPINLGQMEVYIPNSRS